MINFIKWLLLSCDLFKAWHNRGVTLASTTDDYLYYFNNLSHEKHEVWNKIDLIKILSCINIISYYFTDFTEILLTNLVKLFSMSYLLFIFCDTLWQWPIYLGKVIPSFVNIYYNKMLLNNNEYMAHTSRFLLPLVPPVRELPL